MAQANFKKSFSPLLRGEILGRWDQLTTLDLEGCEDRFKLVGLLESRYGYARSRAEKEVQLFFEDFQERLRMAA